MTVVGTIGTVTTRPTRAASSWTSAHRFHAFAVDDLPHASTLPFLVQGVLPAGCIAELHGAPGVGKSFVSIALAMSVATGIPFLGHASVADQVLYVASERFVGLRRRIEAWCTHHAVTDRSRLRVMRDAPQLIEGSTCLDFVRAIGRLGAPPTLIVLDTLSRSLVGADENGQRDMSKAVNALDLIRRDTGAAILLVHHTRKAGDLERGSTVLRGAADLMVAVKPTQTGIVLHADKINDFAPFEDIHARLEPIGDSCVVSESEAPESGGRSRSRRASLTPRDKLALMVLTKYPDGLSVSQWAREAELAPSTLARLAKDGLAAAGLVTLGEGGTRYRLTDAGRARVR